MSKVAAHPVPDCPSYARLHPASLGTFSTAAEGQQVGYQAKHGR